MKFSWLTSSAVLATTLLGASIFSLRQSVGAESVSLLLLNPQTRSHNQIASARVENSSANRYNLLGVSFETSEPLSAPIAIQGNGVGVLYPATATPGNEDFKVTLTSLPPGDLVLEGMNDNEAANWVRFAVLGINRPADGRIERTILGRRLIGDVQLQRTRRQTVEEIYLLPLSSGHRLVITFESNQRLSLQKVERLIGSIAQSMQELSPRSPEWRDSFRWQKRQRD